MKAESLMLEKFGSPTITGYPYLTRIMLPFRMKLSWENNVYINSFLCNYLIHDQLYSVFTTILKEYGPLKISELGIDIYGGCFNYRKIGTSEKWSMHAWGLAVDLDPIRNSYNMTRETAQFAKKEYDTMINIFYENGFVSLGKELDYDWMHFEAV